MLGYVEYKYNGNGGGERVLELRTEAISLE